jgi:hypothetical protein
LQKGDRSFCAEISPVALLLLCRCRQEIS